MVQVGKWLESTITLTLTGKMCQRNQVLILATSMKQWEAQMTLGPWEHDLSSSHLQ